MRLHHLEITAFGPFADTVHVDFDELSGAGLFLLCGATGAGKTSVLDAVCFALYGDVPGDRSAAKRFRCDHAADGVGPRVVLEATLAGRRFRCTRSPAWQRPKKRGTGTTTQQASVLVEERESGAWVALTNRLDEAGHLMTRLLGMTMAQFCQVALLPQGQFQTFLRARSEDRQALLQQLFGTQRFEDVEHWLRDHARALRRESDEHQRSVAQLAGRLLEVTGTGLPDGWEVDRLAEPATSGELARWAAELADTVARDAEEADLELVSTTREQSEAAAALEAANEVAGRRRRHQEAERTAAALSADGEAMRSRRDLVARARRAAPVIPLHRLAEAAVRDRDRLHAEAAEAVRAAVAVLGAGESAPSDGLLAEAEAAARDRAAAARSLLPRERTLDALAADLAVDDEHATHLANRHDELLARLESLPGELAEARGRLADAESARDRTTVLAGLLADVDTRLEAHGRLADVRAEHAEATQELREVVDLCQSLKEQWLDRREARIRDMASELADALAVGASCPVCGSLDHPHKASAGDGRATVEAERSARARLDDAEVTRTALTAKVHELDLRTAVLAPEAGTDDPGSLRQERQRLADESVALSDEAASVTACRAAVATAEQAVEASRADLTTVRVERATVDARLRERRAEHARTAAEVATLLDAHVQTLTGRIDRELRVADACARALAARRDLASADRAAADTERTRTSWLSEQGFADADAALAAVLTDERLRSIEAEVEEHERRFANARSLLADPDLAAAARGEAPDLESLADAASTAGERHASASAARLRAESRASRVGELRAWLVDADRGWAPVRDAHRLASELAALAAGTSGENTWRMRLSAFVLAWRLGQVVAAANERLLRMSDRRYTLEHTGRRGAGENRGGLSLLVRDEWSGDTRDPATLSGGETFVVSLALALGLADVVTHEAGGSDLDTLFVDEGFGALDPDTLDDVMDTLDELREGGRVVGVVSHVAELRTRIPVQLAVTKRRAGSTVSVQRSTA